jgi:hypothetical protein
LPGELRVISNGNTTTTARLATQTGAEGTAPRLCRIRPDAGASSLGRLALIFDVVSTALDQTGYFHGEFFGRKLHGVTGFDAEQT